MAFERIVPGTVEWDLYSGNHRSRYLFAKKIIEEHKCGRVLDAATGVGYGANLLSEVCNEVVAVDRSKEALKIAKDQFNGGKTVFVKDDCESLIAIEGLFDAVVSFETLEHLKHPEKFLNRSFELLKENGILILSTPNQLASGHVTKKDWEFHEREFKPDELFNIIRDAGFRKVELYGQYYSSTGILRNQFRSELNRIHSNPFMRAGQWIQRTFRGIKGRAILPEMDEDFEIKKININAHQNSGQLPFVLIALGFK